MEYHGYRSQETFPPEDLRNKEGEIMEAVTHEPEIVVELRS